MRVVEAEETELGAVGGFGGVEDGLALVVVLGWPVGGVGAPGKAVVGEDEGGAGQVAWAADDLRALPAVMQHEDAAEEDVLNGVERAAFFEDVAGWNALRL